MRRVSSGAVNGTPRADPFDVDERTAVSIEVTNDENKNNGGSCVDSLPLIRSGPSSPGGRKRPSIDTSSKCVDDNAHAASDKRRKTDDNEESSSSSSGEENDELSSRGEHQQEEEEEEEREGEGEAGAASSALSHDSKWEIMFSRLLIYKEKHGNCLVPNRYKEDTKLGSWVSTQRRQYKAFETGKINATTLPQDRIDRLEAIGFVWETSDPRRVEWDIRYKQLCEFRRKYGNSMVPMGYEENVSLANWVSVQRQEYKNLLQRKPSKMSSERIRLLESVDFVWKAPRGARRKHDNGRLLPPGPSNGKRHASRNDHHPNASTSSDDEAEDGDVNHAAAHRGSEQVAVVVGSMRPRGSSPQPPQPRASSSDDVPFPPIITSSGQHGKHVDRRKRLLQYAHVVQQNHSHLDVTTKVAGTRNSASLNPAAHAHQIAIGRRPDLLTGLPAGFLGGPLASATILPHHLPLLVRMTTPNLAGLTMPGNQYSLTYPYQHLLAPSTAAAAIAAEAQMYQRNAALLSFPSTHQGYPLVDMSLLTASLGAGLVQPQISLAEVAMVNEESRRRADELLAQQLGRRKEENLANSGGEEEDEE